MQIIVAKHLCI